jgi:hypothetical protein
MTKNDDKFSKELQYLLASYLFENKLQMQRLLSYLVSNLNSSSDSAYDQRIIARECLGRGEDFDPAENPVVRIEIGRLRKLLSLFYKEELPRPYTITIPRGQYRPEVVVESEFNKPKYLPELVPSPANPERLSVLLQFSTEGVDNTELYLLRHRLRIGITIALSRQETVRLLVAIPGENEKVADSIDFIMRVSVSSVDAGFELASQVYAADSEDVLYRDCKNLSAEYKPLNIDDLLSVLVSELFDHEIGMLWRKWVDKRDDYQKVGEYKISALVRYQRYLFNENKSNVELAFIAITSALEYHPGDKILNLALADIYYRVIIHDYDVVNNPIEDGLMHVREALRFSPGSEKLHTLHALLTMFQRKYDYVATTLMSPESSEGAKYFSASFHYQVLRCLMAEWVDGFDELRKLCDRFSYYPKLFPVLAYLKYFLHGEKAEAEQWKVVVSQQRTYSTLRKCAKHMKLTGRWVGEEGRASLLESLDEDIGKLR